MDKNKKKKKIIDLRRFIEPKIQKPESENAYGSLSEETFFDADLDFPEQRDDR